MPLTSKQKFSLVFGAYVSLFIALAGAVFFLTFHNLLIYQIKKDTARAAVNALKNHVALKADTVTLIKDQTGGQLSDEVIDSNVSILLLDKDLRVIAGYGLLELYDDEDQNSVKTIARIAKDTEKSLKPNAQMISWRGQNLSIYIAPIKYNGQAHGAIVAAKSLTEIQSLEQIILLTLTGLTFISILVSVILSRLLVKRIFKPIHSLTQIISATDLDKLDKALSVEGNKSDELVILGDKFNQMMIRLKSMAEQQKEFITNASHELKTPLSRAISSLDLALSSNEPDKKTLKEMLNDLFEINNLLDRLMFLSKLQPGTILPSEKLSVNKLINESSEEFKEELKTKKLSLHLDIQKDAAIFIPKEYAKMLLGNLLSNAIKYSRENTGISLKTRVSKQELILTITDQGQGINKFDLDKVERRFYRGTGKKTAGGHGIGLSIVRRIADLYKIHFSLRSEPGQGTEATVRFPLY